MGKFPINKRIMDDSGFVNNFHHLSRVTRTTSVSPYTYGAGTTQFGKFRKTQSTVNICRVLVLAKKF